MSMANQTNYLNFNNFDLVVATPSQLEMLWNYNRVKNLRPKFIVVDESDVLLHFNPSLSKFLLGLISELNADASAKVVLSAASFPERINGKPFETFLHKYFPGMRILKSSDFLKVPSQIEHGVIESEDIDLPEKIALLVKLIPSSVDSSFIVFVRNGSHVKSIAEVLASHNITSLGLTSEMSDTDRLYSLYRFKNGKASVLICTDVVCRGVHIDFDCHVVQFDCAENAVSLLHRFGRTGRMGRKGVVTTFMTQKDRPLLERFQGMIDSKNDISPIISRKRSFSKRFLESKGRTKDK